MSSNFQSFNKTDIKLSNESASVSQSDKRIYLIEFNKDGEFTLNKQSLSQRKIKAAILESKKNDEEFMVVLKGSKDTDIQDILNIIADFKVSNINEITIGISKKEVDDKLPHIPGVQRYSDALIRKNPTLNTAWLCD